MTALVRWFGLVELAGLRRGALFRDIAALPSPPFRAVRLERREDVPDVIRALLASPGESGGGEPHESA
ncbi:MAG: DUF444 domain-containing protein, partial [Sulfobacillus sp.]|nr:DUF444 domain-containing protein [Sulfobacillus sp.]